MSHMAPRYGVRVVNRSKVAHVECPTDDRRQAEQYARTAIEDGCLSSTVFLSRNGYPVSWWDAEELRHWEEAST